MNLSTKHFGITILFTFFLQNAAFSMNFEEPSASQCSCCIDTIRMLNNLSEADTREASDVIVEEKDTRRLPKVTENIQATIDDYTAQILKFIDVEAVLISAKELDIDRENLEKVNYIFSCAAENLNSDFFAQFIHSIWQIIKYNSSIVNTILIIAVEKRNTLILQNYWRHYRTTVEVK